MKITIDTKEDSHEDIKKVVQLLSTILGQNSSTPSNIFENSSSEVPSLMGMFDASPEKSEQPKLESTEKKEPSIEMY